MINKNRGDAPCGIGIVITEAGYERSLTSSPSIWAYSRVARWGRGAVEVAVALCSPFQEHLSASILMGWMLPIITLGNAHPKLVKDDITLL